MKEFSLIMMGIFLLLIWGLAMNWEREKYLSCVDRDGVWSRGICLKKESVQ